MQPALVCDGLRVAAKLAFIKDIVCSHTASTAGHTCTHNCIVFRANNRPDTDEVSTLSILAAASQVHLCRLRRLWAEARCAA